jgi:uncharacterized protein (DUF488 family)
VEAACAARRGEGMVRNMSSDSNPRVPSPVFTVGHSNRSWPEFIRVIQAAAIGTIVDIRRFPVSRRHPHFCRDAMIGALAGVSIGYRHCPDLGGFRDGDAAAAVSVNDGWPPGFFRNYADYALTPAFAQALTQMCAALTPGTAIMCAEKDWSSCHRRIVTDYLIVAGYRVVHVIDKHDSEDASLTPFASVDDDGGIVYRARNAQFNLDFGA